MNLTVPEAARRAGRSPETIRRWIWSGRLPAVKIGNQHVIESATLDGLIAPSEVEPAEVVVDVPGEPGVWLRRAEALGRALKERGARVPRAAEIVRASRRAR